MSITFLRAILSVLLFSAILSSMYTRIFPTTYAIEFAYAISANIRWHWWFSHTASACVAAAVNTREPTPEKYVRSVRLGPVVCVCDVGMFFSSAHHIHSLSLTLSRCVSYFSDTIFGCRCLPICGESFFFFSLKIASVIYVMIFKYVCLIFPHVSSNVRCVVFSLAAMFRCAWQQLEQLWRIFRCD